MKTEKEIKVAIECCKISKATLPEIPKIGYRTQCPMYPEVSDVFCAECQFLEIANWILQKIE